MWRVILLYGYRRVRTPVKCWDSWRGAVRIEKGSYQHHQLPSCFFFFHLVAPDGSIFSPQHSSCKEKLKCVRPSFPIVANVGHTAQRWMDLLPPEKRYLKGKEEEDEKEEIKIKDYYMLHGIYTLHRDLQRKNQWR